MMVGVDLAAFVNIWNSSDSGKETRRETQNVQARTIISDRIATLPRGVPHATARPVPQNAVRKGDLVETERRLE